MNTALYALRNEYIELTSKLADMDLDAQTVADTIEASGLTDSINDKAQNLMFVANQFDSHVAAMETEIARLTALRNNRKKVADGLRAYLLDTMRLTGIKKIDGPLIHLSVRENPPAVDVFEYGLIPAQFMRHPDPPAPVPDKPAIKSALQAGQDVPGCRLVRGVSLRIS